MSEIFYEDKTSALLLIKNLSIEENMKKDMEQKYQQMLISSISHEVKTPANGIYGIASNLSGIQEMKKYELDLSLLKISAEQLLLYVNMMEDFSLVNSELFELNLSEIRISELFKKLFQNLNLLFKQKHLELKLKSSIPNSIFVDPKRIELILMILIHNGLKYTMNGFVELQIEENEDSLRFLIIDTGIGIPNERLSTIFNLFNNISNSNSLNPQGIGLGLHLCKLLISKMKGQINVYSKEGEGTTFEILIEKCQGREPVHSSINSERNELISIDDPNLQLRSNCQICSRALIVDDNLTNRFVLGAMLTKLNIKFEEAENGKESITKVEKKLSSDCCQQYHWIFMDINMPIMDGDIATKIIRTKLINKSKTKIYTITAAQIQNEKQKKKYTESGFNGIYEKPVSFEIIQSIIKNDEEQKHM